MKTVRCLSFLSILLTSANCRADSTLEYLIKANRTPSNKIQSVLVKSGNILIKAVGGNAQLDLLYNRSPEKLFVIDHKKRSVMTVNEQLITTMGKTAEAAQPLLQGLSKQLARMDPKQRAKWQQMLGNSVSLDKISVAAKPPKTATLIDTGKNSSATGVNCKQFNVLADNVPSAELCLASQNNLQLSDNDYATLIALLNFSNKIVDSSHGLAGQFGVNIPSISLQNIAGIPIEIHDLTKNGNGSIALERISNTPISAAPMQAPQDYKSEPFALFK